MAKNKKVKEGERVAGASINVNIAEEFRRTIKRRRLITKRAIEGVIRYWISLPAEQQIEFISQERQLGDVKMAVERRIDSPIDAHVADEFYRQIREHGVFTKDVFEAAIGAWVNLSAEKQTETIRREEKQKH